MYFRDVVTLIKETYAPDEIGNMLPTAFEKNVYANVNTISLRDFFDASVNGLKPSIAFIIRTCDYDDEGKVKYKDTIYRVLKADTLGDNTRLVCEVVTGK